MSDLSPTRTRRETIAEAIHGADCGCSDPVELDEAGEYYLGLADAVLALPEIRRGLAVCAAFDKHDQADRDHIEAFRNGGDTKTTSDAFWAASRELARLSLRAVGVDDPAPVAAFPELMNARVKFWMCPNRAHRMVTWIADDIARCDECGATSADPAALTGDCERDCQVACAYPGQFGCGAEGTP